MLLFSDKKIILLLFLILSCHVLKSQDTIINLKKNCNINGCSSSWSLYTSADLTYTGYSSILGIEYEKNKSCIYSGVKILLSKMYLFERGPYGGNIGYRYLFLTNHTRWRFFFNIDYQIAFYNAFLEQGKTGKKKNYIQEINLSYGVRFKISNKFYAGQSIGIGKYFESYYNYKVNNRNSLSGYDALIRLFIKYQFKGE